MAAVLAAAEDAGLTKAAIARISGVHRSQVSRWFSGEQRPGYDPAMRLAGYLEKNHPELAPAFTAAAGYSGPVEPDPDVVPSRLREVLREELPEDEAARLEAIIEAALQGRIPPRNRQPQRSEKAG